MATEFKCHPALKHGIYSPTAVLPNENPAEFKKLRRSLVAELRPNGAMEHNIVAQLARYVWRRKNLATFRYANYRANLLSDERFIEQLRILEEMDPAEREAKLAPFRESRYHEDIAKVTTNKHLIETLQVEERLNTMIDRCLKRLLFVRGLKSISTASASGPSRRLSAPSKAARHNGQTWHA
jgi:hypothetical protein